ncbi:unnamed protein product [Choristocarpus tenellus]
MTTYTIVLEVEGSDHRETERIRWRGHVFPSVSSGALVDSLVMHLDKHFSRLREFGEGRGYLMQFYHNDEGWSPLTADTPIQRIPRTCLVHVQFVPDNAESPASAGLGDSSVLERRLYSRSESGCLDKDAEIRPRALLALPWRNFELDFGGGGLLIRDIPLFIRDVSNSEEGTGFFTWDGAVMLAKYLEHTTPLVPFTSGKELSPPEMVWQGPSQGEQVQEGVLRGGERQWWRCQRQQYPRVLELGCGTGLAGLSAAALGAREVILSDLLYALDNTRANVYRNRTFLRTEEEDEGGGSGGGEEESTGQEGRGVVRVRELDWREPLPLDLMDGGEFDLVLAADVVWLDDLVLPLVETLERVTEGWVKQGINAASHIAGAAAAKVDREGDVCRMGDWGEVMKGEGGHGDECERRDRREVLLAYQWRSSKTGKTLLEALGRSFNVQEVPPEVCM